MTTQHQDTSTERERFESWMAPKLKAGSHLRKSASGVYLDNRVAAKWSAWQAALASRDEVAQPAKEKIAPVQGYTPGIPWSMHLEAYDVYRNRWGAQPALIDLDGRNCRGGFSVRELDEFIPGWRDRLSELVKLREEVTRLRSELAAQQPQGQAVSDAGDEAAHECLSVLAGIDTYEVNLCDHHDAYKALDGYTRAILALRDKPATSPDGTPNNAV